MATRSCYFNDKWLDDPQFSSWLVPGKTATFARCNVCHKEFSVASMGLTAVRSHMKGAKHVQRLPSAEQQQMPISAILNRTTQPTSPSPGSPASPGPGSAAIPLESSPDFPNLWPALKMLLVLSHGQASVERGFSVNKEVMVENLQEQTLIARRVICEAVRKAGGVCKVDVSSKLVQYAASSHQKYQLFLEEKKRENEESVRSLKRKADQEVVDILMKRKKQLEEERRCLKAEADDLAEKAERQKKHSLICQSNALRKSASNKKEEIKRVEEELVSARDKLAK